MLRPSVLAEIHNVLQAKDLRVEDFAVEKSVTELGVQILINYRYDSDFWCLATIAISNFSLGHTSVRMRPGNFLLEETQEALSFDQFLGELYQWVLRIELDLKSLPVYRRVSQVQEELDELARRLGEIPEEYFTRDEAAEVIRRLDELEARLTANMSDSAKAEQLVEDKLEQLHRDFEVLREQTAYLKKGGWMKSVATRVLLWSKDPTNRQLLKSGAEVAKSLMLESGDKPS